MLRAIEEGRGISMDGRRLCGRVQYTLPSTVLCIAAGISAAAPLAPISADTVPIKGSESLYETGRQEERSTEQNAERWEEMKRKEMDRVGSE